MFILRADTIINEATNHITDQGTAAITCAWRYQKYAGQEFITNLDHPDYLAFLLMPKIAQVRATRNRKLDEIDIRICNALNLELMTAAEKTNWETIKNELIAITDPGFLTVSIVDGYLNSEPGFWPI